MNHYKENDRKLYLFEKIKPSHYEYKGEVEAIGKPFQEQQNDTDGKERKVYVFPLKTTNK